jgi:hypothetical protein
MSSFPNDRPGKKEDSQPIWRWAGRVLVVLQYIWLGVRVYCFRELL